MKHKLQSRLPGEISVTDIQMTHPSGKKWRRTKELFDDAWKSSLFTLMKVKEESEKADLKLNIQKTKIMAGPIR